MDNKAKLVALLHTFIAQRPGLDYREYGDVSAYRSEVRGITKQLQDARAMLRYIEWHESITDQDILDCASSGRLSIAQNGEGFAIDYTTGQYWPTEYRGAVARLCASVIWSYLRANRPGCTGGDIRNAAKRELGLSIARKYFN